VVDQKWVHDVPTDVGITYSTIDEYQYTYDANGNVVSKTNPLDTAYNETYTYDDLDQLANMTRGGSAYQSFDDDALGNMDSVTTGGTTSNNTISGNNELTGLGNATLAYDNDGNTTTDDQGHTLVYDAWNRLVQVKSGGSAIEIYSYDALGHRITEQPAGSLQNNLYYSNQWQVIEEDVSNSGLLLHADYVWSPVFVDALVLRDDHLVGTYNGTTFNFSDRLYATQDANYNVTALVAYSPEPADTNDDGQVNLSDLNTVLNNLGTTTSGGSAYGDVNGDGHVDLSDLNAVLNALGTTEGIAERFVYDAYGNSITLTKTWTSTTDAYAWQYKYQGGRYDATTGLYDFRNREYSPTMMRWTTQDPMGYVDGMNDYGFVRENPQNLVDPQGFDSEPSIPTGPAVPIDPASAQAQAVGQAKATEQNVLLVAVYSATEQPVLVMKPNQILSVPGTRISTQFVAIPFTDFDGGPILNDKSTQYVWKQKFASKDDAFKAAKALFDDLSQKGQATVQPSSQPDSLKAKFPDGTWINVRKDDSKGNSAVLDINRGGGTTKVRFMCGATTAPTTAPN
jgi:RHS repeat-associated protein